LGASDFTRRGTIPYQYGSDSWGSGMDSGSGEGSYNRIKLSIPPIRAATLLTALPASTDRIPSTSITNATGRLAGGKLPIP